jgi:hypothetical protein
MFTSIIFGALGVQCSQRSNCPESRSTYRKKKTWGGVEKEYLGMPLSIDYTKCKRGWH